MIRNKILTKTNILIWIGLFLGSIVPGIFFRTYPLWIEILQALFGATLWTIIIQFGSKKIKS